METWPISGSWYVLLLPTELASVGAKIKKKDAGAPCYSILFTHDARSWGSQAHPPAQFVCALAFTVFTGFAFASVFVPPDLGQTQIRRWSIIRLQVRSSSNGSEVVFLRRNGRGVRQRDARNRVQADSGIPDIAFATFLI